MKRIEHLIKTNRIIQKIYIIVFTTFFCFIRLFLRIDKKLVLFNSFSGKLFNDSPRILFEKMKNDPRFEGYRFVWAFTNPQKYKEVVDCKVVKQDSFKYFITAMKARYWITNVNIERGLKIKRKGNIYLNTWHGTGPKKGGNAVKGRKDYNFSNVNYILADGEFLKKIFIESFNAKESNIKVIGRPREDFLFAHKDDQSSLKKELLEKFRLPSNKKYILFAPTWRETTNHGKSYSIGSLFNLSYWVEELGPEYVILFRAHSITNEYAISQHKNIVDVTKVDNINELYILADILISDYSSCFTDFSIFGKPMFCFAPDYDSYSEQRGLLYDLNEFFTSGVIKDEKTLITAIKSMDYTKEKENTLRFSKKFISCNGHATEKCIDLLLSNVKS